MEQSLVDERLGKLVRNCPRKDIKRKQWFFRSCGLIRNIFAERNEYRLLSKDA